MFSKIIIVLATAYVINASVLTVNLFDDDPKTQDASNPKDCNFQECDQLCRRLKFPGGACVNGRCKCDNFLNAEVFAESISNPEESVSPRACNHQKCYNLCRKIKLRGGFCIEGKCTCSKYLSDQDDMTDPAEFLSPRSCDFRACDQQCFRFGYAGGSCVNGRCKCGNFRSTEDSMTDSVESVPLSTCNSIACDDQCRRTGWHSGVCVKGQCKCDYFLNTEDDAPTNKFPGGTCGNSCCKCDNLFGTEDAVDEYSELSTRGIFCNLTRCNRTCTRRGYVSARCVYGRCKCYNKIQRQDASSLLSAVNEDEESNVILRTNKEELILPSPRACHFMKCMQMCYRLKYDVGWCLSGRCECYKN